MWARDRSGSSEAIRMEKQSSSMPSRFHSGNWTRLRSDLHSDSATGEPGDGGLVRDLYQYRSRNRQSLFIQRKLPTAKSSDRLKYSDENERPLVETRTHSRSMAAGS